MPAAWRDRPYGRFRPVPEAVPRQRAGRLTTQRSANTTSGRAIDEILLSGVGVAGLCR
jgi:hypothetical protein